MCTFHEGASQNPMLSFLYMYVCLCVCVSLIYRSDSPRPASEYVNNNIYISMKILQ